MVATLAAFPARALPRPHAGPAASRRYERRRPEKTPLYKIVSECLESWLADRSAREHPVAAYVEEEFRGYLTCHLGRPRPRPQVHTAGSQWCRGALAV
jgi:hypothetical protein